MEENITLGKIEQTVQVWSPIKFSYKNECNQLATINLKKSVLGKKKS